MLGDQSKLSQNNQGVKAGLCRLSSNINLINSTIYHQKQSEKNPYSRIRACCNNWWEATNSPGFYQDVTQAIFWQERQLSDIGSAPGPLLLSFAPGRSGIESYHTFYRLFFRDLWSALPSASQYLGLHFPFS